MHVLYNDKTDLLYIRLDDRRQEVINRRVSADIVLAWMFHELMWRDHEDGRATG